MLPDDRVTAGIIPPTDGLLPCREGAWLVPEASTLASRAGGPVHEFWAGVLMAWAEAR